MQCAVQHIYVGQADLSQTAICQKNWGNTPQSSTDRQLSGCLMTLQAFVRGIVLAPLTGTTRRKTMIETLPVGFTLSQFRKVTPLDESNIWTFLFDRNSERIGVKRRETALENLEKIFGATFRLANTVGFQAMTLRDLCRETGLSMGGLYGYIENKDQLAAMIEDAIRHASDLLLSWFTHIKSPLDHIECILRAFVCLSEILQPWLYFVYLESRTLPTAQRKTAKASELSAHLHIARLIEATGTVSSEKAFLLAAHCMAMVQDWYVKPWKYHSAKISPDEFADSIVLFIRSRIDPEGLSLSNKATARIRAKLNP
jgi:AcrR family transcriptional regulator